MEDDLGPGLGEEAPEAAGLADVAITGRKVTPRSRAMSWISCSMA
jgi:hypothetical protein